MFRAASVLLPLAILAGSASATRQLSRATERRAASTAGQPPGDVGAITGPVNVVGTLGQNIANAAGEVQAAAAQASQPVIQDPQSALGGAVGAAEGIMQNLVPGRGLVTDVLAKSQAAPTTPAPARTMPAPRAAFAPAPLNGVYCRGAACQYRPDVAGADAAQQAGVSKPVEPFDDKSVSQQDLSQKEFCRGLSCVPGSGHLPDFGREQFVNHCVHLLADLGGGLQGDDESRGVVDVHNSVQQVCKSRVDIHEADFCKDYAAVFVAALSPLYNEQTVGDARQVCSSTLYFMSLAKRAEVDLQLFDASPPQGGNSSSSPSGATALLAAGQVEIVPGSPDGVLPAVQVSSSLFSSCSKQLGAVTKGKAQSALKTVSMAKEWCGLQTIITSWDDVKGKKGQVHPEWNAETCLGISQLMAFALREDMESKSKMPAKKVCKNLFMAIGAIHGVDRLVDNAQNEVTRGLPAMGLALPAGDPAMLALAEDAKKRSEAVMSRLEKEKKAAEALKSAKAQVAAYSSQAALVAVSRAVRLRRGSRAAAAAA